MLNHIAEVSEILAVEIEVDRNGSSIDNLEILGFGMSQHNASEIENEFAQNNPLV